MHNVDVRAYADELDKCEFLTDKERFDLIAEYREYLDQLDYDNEFWSMVG